MPEPWRTPAAVAARHQRMVELHAVGLQPKEIAIAIKVEFGADARVGRHQSAGRALTRWTVTHHLNGRCRCAANGYLEDTGADDRGA